MDDNHNDPNIRFRDVFKGIGGFFDLLTDMVQEDRDRYTRKGEIGSSKNLKGAYQLSVKLGAVEEDVEGLTIKRENDKLMRQNRISQSTLLFDIFDEGAYYRVIAELPDVDADEISVDIHQDTVLIIRSRYEDKEYHKVEFTEKVNENNVDWRFLHSILEIRIWKK
jgi:HSP20 family molecular chaperone IbpA